MSRLASHLVGLPAPLAEAIEQTFQATVDHYLKREWDDAQVDAGRFCEAALRYLQWKQKGSYTPIDGKSKPNRKGVVNAVQNDASLEASLRAQIPQAVELVMDFRNNRNSAHLGNLDANQLDAVTVIHLVQWVAGEIVRLETSQSSSQVQALLDEFSQPYVPLIQFVAGSPTVLDPSMPAADKALVLLYQVGTKVELAELRKWAEYSNATRWREKVVGELAKEKMVLIKDGSVHLLNPGAARAQKLLVGHE